MSSSARSGVRRLIVGSVVPAVLVAATLLVALERETGGQWPFRPLDRREHRVDVEGGATVTVTGIEDRGWLSDGYRWSAAYADSSHSQANVFAQWVGHDGGVVAVRDGDALVCLTPDRRWLHLLRNSGPWRRFDLWVPAAGAADAGDGADRLSAHDVRQLDAWLGQRPANATLAATIRSYDPAEHVLAVDLAIAPRRIMDVHLDPAAGRLTLLRLRAAQ